MKISILVNTCDAFEDCWDPFFLLFKEYWPDFNGTLYLNTEVKSYSYPGLNIIPLKVAERKNVGPFELSWSQCLIDALNFIDDDIILYMQEDYFLHNFVKNDLVTKYLKYINDHGNIGCIHLTDQGTQPDLAFKKSQELYPANLNHRDLLSCQAAFWRKTTLLKCLKPSESGWQFEEFGSKRAKFLNLGIYAIDRSYIRKNEYEIIPYLFTGIVQGRWIKEVPALFEKHNIKVDFSQRGFVKERKKITLLNKIKRKIKKFPLKLISYKDIFILKNLNKRINKAIKI